MMCNNCNKRSTEEEFCGQCEEEWIYMEDYNRLCVDMDPDTEITLAGLKYLIRKESE